MKLGQMLLNSGLITREQLEQALKRQRDDGGRIGYNLVKMRAISEEELNNYLARQHRIESVNLDEVDIPQDVIDLIPADIARRYEVVPIQKVGKTLVVAMTDPDNLYAIDDLRFTLGMEIESHSAPPCLPRHKPLCISTARMTIWSRKTASLTAAIRSRWKPSWTFSPRENGNME